VTLKFGRDDETEADLVGMELAARGRLRPARRHHAVEQDGRGEQGRAAEWLSTHRAAARGFKDIEANLAKVMPLYERAAKPSRRFGPPAPRAETAVSAGGR